MLVSIQIYRLLLQMVDLCMCVCVQLFCRPPGVGPSTNPRLCTEAALTNAPHTFATNSRRSLCASYYIRIAWELSALKLLLATNLNILEFDFDRRASSVSKLDRRAKTHFLILGDANHAFCSTSVGRERNYTPSRRSDQNCVCISFEKRRARAKQWWGRIDTPFGTISLLS